MVEKKKKIQREYLNFKGRSKGELNLGGVAPELANQTENTRSRKKLRNDCNAGITELFDPQLRPLTEASNWKYLTRKL